MVEETYRLAAEVDAYLTLDGLGKLTATDAGAVLTLGAPASSRSCPTVA